MQRNLSSASGERLKVLDVIRGVTMILVVFHHVRGVTFGLYGTPSPLSEFFVAFRMPMFFFISGFVAYKAVEAWTWDFFRRRLVKKAMVELVPTAVFFALFMGLTDWKWTFPGGYWFTVSLFGMLAVYYIISALSRVFFPSLRLVMLIFAGVALYVLPYVVDIPADIPYFPVLKTCSFFIYFVYGVAMGSVKPVFFKVVSHPVVVATMAVVGVGALVVLRQFQVLPGEVKGALTFVGGFSLLNLIFAVFYTRRSFWNADGRLSRILQFVGRRTLDVYMIHWFLLPRLPMLHEFLLPASENAVIELILVGGVSVAVTGACIGVSAVLRTSPLLGHILFGAPLPRKDIPVSAETVLSPSEGVPSRRHRRRAAIVLPRMKMPHFNIISGRH